MTTIVDEPEVVVVVDDKGTPMPGSEPEPTTVTDPDPSVTEPEKTAVLSEPVSSETDPDTEPKGDSTEEPKGDESAALSPELIEALGKAYSKELVETPGVKQTVAEMVEAEVARQTQEANRDREVTATSTKAIEDGRKAILELTSQAASARDNLQKAAEGKNFDPNALDAQDFANNIKLFSTAVVADFQQQYNRAVEEGFQDVFVEILPKMSDEQVKELGSIVAAHAESQRDAKTINTGRTEFITNLFKFVSKRGIEHGSTKTTDAISAKQTVAGQVADSNAIRVAKAEIEKQKGPPAVEPGSETVAEAVGLEAYAAAVAEHTPEGNLRAQQIVDAMGQNR